MSHKVVKQRSGQVLTKGKYANPVYVNSLTALVCPLIASSYKKIIFSTYNSTILRNYSCLQ